MSDISHKRENALDWDEYFMATAFLSAMRSKDPCTQVGACIVNKKNRIVGIGYNGMPTGCSDDKLSWANLETAQDPLDNKHLYVCHAEMNAILNKNSTDLEDCVLYVALFPCNECAKFIIQSGIKEVVYMSNKYGNKLYFKAARRLLDVAGIKYRQYIPKNKQIVIDFSKIETNSMLQIPTTPIKQNRPNDEN